MRFSLLPLLAITLSAQPAFEVASIRPLGYPGTGVAICGINLRPEASVSGADGKLVSGANSLAVLVVDAYQDDVVDTINFPQWAFDAGRFAISVKIPPNTTAGKCREMLRNLLADRFHLVTSIETVPVGRYYLRVAKSGLKLKAVENPPADPNKVFDSWIADSIVHYAYRGAPLSRMLDVIQIVVNDDARARGLRDDPKVRFAPHVIDETGLTGYYNGSLDAPVRPTPLDGLSESLDDLLTRQLGLTLEFRKAPGKVLIIHSGDRIPTEN